MEEVKDQDQQPRLNFLEHPIKQEPPTLGSFAPCSKETVENKFIYSLWSNLEFYKCSISGGDEYIGFISARTEKSINLSHIGLKLLDDMNPVMMTFRKLKTKDIQVSLAISATKSMQPLCISAVRVHIMYENADQKGIRTITFPVNINTQASKTQWIGKIEDSILNLHGPSQLIRMSLEFEQTMDNREATRLLEKYVPTRYCENDVWLVSSDNRVFPCNRTLLAEQSPGLADQIGPGTIFKPFEMRWPMFNGNVIDSVLRFLYFGDTTMPMSNIPLGINVYFAANDFNIPRLRDIMYEHLMRLNNEMVDIPILIQILQLPNNLDYICIRTKAIELLLGRDMRELQQSEALRMLFHARPDITMELFFSVPWMMSNLILPTLEM